MAKLTDRHMTFTHRTDYWRRGWRISRSNRTYCGYDIVWQPSALLCNLKLMFSGEGDHPSLAGGLDHAREPGGNDLVEARPYFRSHGQKYRIKVGESVTMSCVVEDLGEPNDLSVYVEIQALRRGTSPQCVLFFYAVKLSLDSLPHATEWEKNSLQGHSHVGLLHQSIKDNSA